MFPHVSCATHASIGDAVHENDVGELNVLFTWSTSQVGQTMFGH